MTSVSVFMSRIRGKKRRSIRAGQGMTNSHFQEQELQNARLVFSPGHETRSKNGCGKTVDRLMQVLHFTLLHFQSCWSWVQTAKFTTQLLQKCVGVISRRRYPKSCHISAPAPFEKLHFTFCSEPPCCKVQSAECKLQNFWGRELGHSSLTSPNFPPLFSPQSCRMRNAKPTVCRFDLQFAQPNLRTTVDWMHKDPTHDTSSAIPCKPRMRYARQANPTPL